MNPSESSHEIRLQEAEVKLAFLERDLVEYREVVDSMHGLLTRLEKQLQELKDSRDSTRSMEEFWRPEEP